MTPPHMFTSSKVLDEIGVDFGQTVPDAPEMQPASAAEEKTAAPAAAAAAAEGGGSDPAMSELEQRLNNLRR